MKRFLFLSLLLGSSALVAPLAQAQTLSADEIAGKVEAAQKSTKDFSAHIQGQANFDANPQKIDLKISSIPAQSIIRIEFAAPDALADNILILDKKNSYNYLYLTNQITISSLEKTKVEGFNFDFARFADFNSNLSRDKFTLKVLPAVQLKEGKAYILEATPKDLDSGNGRTRVWILENGWRPIKMQALDTVGKIQADLSFSEWKTNSGLTPKDLKKWPKDAQVIKK
jgi:outer membrane lipoprotein-sorting protein